jgi:hypothetical protein
LPIYGLFKAKRNKKKRFFNIDLETIIKIFKDLDTLDELQKDKEALRLRNENLKIQNVIKYINENLESISNINNEILKSSIHETKSLEPGDDTSIKIDVLHEDYIIYCRKEGIVPNLRAGICDFEKICEKHTSIGKLNEDFEFNFVKFKD